MTTTISRRKFATLATGAFLAGGMHRVRRASAAERIKLRVGTVPISGLAPFYLAMERGYFKEENLDVEPVMQAGGAQVVAVLTAGELDVGWSAVTSTLVAAAQRLPIRIVAAGTVSPKDPDSMRGQPVVVGNDSPIKSINDLKGKSIAVNSRGGLLEIMIAGAMSKHGVDPATVRWVELPLPDMIAALSAKQVDVIAAAEPFYTLARESGKGRAIFDAFFEAGPGLPVGHWVATNPYAEKNAGDALARFKRVMKKANIYGNENPEAARKIIQTYTRIPPEIVGKIALQPWSDDVDIDGLRNMEKLTRQFGPRGLSKVDIESLILKTQ